MGLIKSGFACEGGGIIGVAMSNNDSRTDEDQAVNQKLGLYVSSAVPSPFASFGHTRRQQALQTQNRGIRQVILDLDISNFTETTSEVDSRL